MIIKVIVDNNTYIDQYYLGEPAVCYYIEIDGYRILFDTGYSDILLSNAMKMDIQLSELTHIVLSHGHNDHTNGLKFLESAADFSKVKIISHPHCFHPKFDGDESIGAPYSLEEICRKTDYLPSGKPLFLSENCVFLGQIPQKNFFEIRTPIGMVMTDESWQEDYLLDDSALAFKTSQGVFLITGCSHSGVCNIAAYAMEVCNDSRIAGILGGFHLFDVNERLAKTIKYLESCHVQKLYPCHCVSLAAKAKMMERLPVEEVGVGLTIVL